MVLLLLQRSLWLVKFYQFQVGQLAKRFGDAAPIAVKRSGCLRNDDAVLPLFHRCQQRHPDPGFGFHLEAGADLPKWRLTWTAGNVEREEEK